MRILLTTHQFFPEYAAGTEVLTYSVARELMNRGHIVHVFTGYPGSADLHEDDRFDEYDFDGIHVYRFHHAYTPMAGQASMIEIGYDNRLAAKFFKQMLEKFTPDIVHFFHLNRLGTGLIEHAVNAGIPCYMTPTDFWVICPTGQLVLGDGMLCAGPSDYAGNCVKHLALSTQNRVIGKIARCLPTASIDLLVRFTQAGVLPHYPHQIEVQAMGSRLEKNIARLNQLNKVVSPNGFMTEKLLQYGVMPNLIVQSAYGINVSTSATKYKQRISCEPLRLGFIGTLASHKGCHILIEAFKLIPRGQATLKIYGNMLDFPDYVDNLMHIAGDHDTIEFCGTFPNSKIGDVLAEIDALVVPSLWYENTPLVVYSAQAALCPVVASDFPGISEVIHDQVNGLLFDAGNAGALAMRLSRLINEPDLLANLSMNCRQPKTIAMYLDELQEIWEC